MKNLLYTNDGTGTYPPSFYAAGINELKHCEPLTGSHHCDVCIVGGGFTGLSVALHLAQRGYNVKLLEAQRIGFGTSGRNGGQIGRGQRCDQDELEQMFGIDRARELWTIAAHAVELVRELSASEHVDATFHDGILHADHKARYTEHSRSYVEKMQQSYNEGDIVFIPPADIRNHVNSPAYHSGILDKRSGHIDPLQLALGIGRMAQAAGASLHEQSCVTKMSSGKKNIIHTDSADITADYVVLACNGYIGDLHRDVTRRVMPINNYIVAVSYTHLTLPTKRIV